MSPTSIVFSVPGTPRPKARARKGKQGHWYTPDKTTNYEATVRTYFLAAAGRCGWVRPSGPIGVLLLITRPNNRRVDVDNIAKLVLDSLNTYAFKDDSQVVANLVYKTVDPDRVGIVVGICCKPSVSSIPLEVRRQFGMLTP